MNSVLTFATALSLAALFPFCGGGLDRPSIDEVSSESVTYQTEDGVTISAGWFLPDGEAKPRVVILLHELDGSRAQWNELIPILRDKGYAVLAPDLRGHGDSGGELSNPLDALRDVSAALTWLKSRSDVDRAYIGIIGAGLGGDLAYVSTGVFPEVDVAVAITPKPYKPDDPLLTSISDFAAHDVFIMAGGERQWEDAVSLGVKVQNPDGRRYIDHSELEGVALMTIDDPIKDILDWLKTRFDSPVPRVWPAPTPSE